MSSATRSANGSDLRDTYVPPGLQLIEQRKRRAALSYVHRRVHDPAGPFCPEDYLGLVQHLGLDDLLAEQQDLSA